MSDADSNPPLASAIPINASAGAGAERAEGPGTAQREDAAKTVAAKVSAGPVGAPGAASSPGTADPPPPMTLADGATERDQDATTRTLVGQVVDGRYRLVRPLAQGGMGSVWLAEQVNLSRMVAVKLMDNPDPELVERFRREAVALTEVSHPAIVEIYDFSMLHTEEGDRGCLVMAFIDGMDLGDYLDQQAEKRLDPREARILMLPVVSALVELHANGIIHRDIKPDNIVRFMRADGRPGVKLVDFGIARRQLDAGMTASGYVLGTPPYLPPETMLGERHTPLSDVYALGATLFELLTGEPPYGSDSAGQIIQRALSQEPVFPKALRGTAIEALLQKMLVKTPSKRLDSMQVLQALEQMREPLAPAARGEDEPPPRPTRPLVRATTQRAASLTTPPDPSGGARPPSPSAPRAVNPSAPRAVNPSAPRAVNPLAPAQADNALPDLSQTGPRLGLAITLALLAGGGLGALIMYLVLR